MDTGQGNTDPHGSPRSPVTAGRRPAVAEVPPRTRRVREAFAAKGWVDRLVNQLGIGAVKFTIDGRVLSCNEAVWRRMGYPSEEAFAAIRMTRHVVEDDQRSELIRRLLAEDVVRGFDLLLRCADGSPIWVKAEFAAVRGEAGKVVAVEGLVLDDTDRKMQEQRLERSEAALQLVLETAPDAVVGFDEAGFISAWNSSAERLLGWSGTEAIGQNVVDLLASPEHADEYLRGFSRVHEVGQGTGNPVFQELELKRKDGARLPMELAMSSPVVFGERQRYVAFLRDITERQRAAAEVQVNRDRLNTAMANAPILLVTLDADLRFTFAGGRAMLGIGLDVNDLVGSSALDLVPDRPDIVEFLRRALGGEDVVEESEFAGRFLHLRLSPLMAADDTIAGISIVGIDITERRDAERDDQARQTQRAAALELTREALVGIDLPDLMQSATELCARTLGADLAAIRELEGAAGTSRRLAHTGYSDPGDDNVVLTPNSLIRWMLEHEEGAVVSDYAESEITCPLQLAAEGVRSTLATPIRGSSGSFGFLAVHSRTPRIWTDDEKEFMQLVGNVLWVALERQRSEADRRRLLSRLVEAQEQERRRIAADVHDDAVQVMTAVTMRLHLLSNHLVDKDQLAAAQQLESTVSLSIDRLRGLLFELSPPALEQHGLRAGLTIAIEQFQRDFGIPARLQHGLGGDPPQGPSLVVYRIVQEALTNIHKHAHASQVTVSLSDHEGGVLARVHDDGVGFDANAGPGGGYGHLGLVSMRERADMAGGWWRLESGADGGTTVEFWIPIPRESGEEAEGAA